MCEAHLLFDLGFYCSNCVLLFARKLVNGTVEQRFDNNFFSLSFTIPGKLKVSRGVRKKCNNLISLCKQAVLQQEERKAYFHHPLDQTIAIAVSEASFAWQERTQEKGVDSMK